jgi:hypothetical protein
VIDNDAFLNYILSRIWGMTIEGVRIDEWIC